MSTVVYTPLLDHKRISAQGHIEISPGAWLDPESIVIYYKEVPPEDPFNAIKTPILFETYDEIFTSPSIGKAFAATWSQLGALLQKAKAGDPVRFPNPNEAKAQRGGWVGGLYQGNHRTAKKLIETMTLTIDIDANGDVDRAATAFASMRTWIHSTYKSTPEKPRCRVVLLLSEPLRSHEVYSQAHKALTRVLVAAGYSETDIDTGSDASRVNYLPMFQPGVTPDFRATSGRPLDVQRLLLANPPPTKKRSNYAPTNGTKSEGYKIRALARAGQGLALAHEGARHTTLFREAAALARAELGASDAEIYEALLEPFVRAAGESRRHEGERAIHDGIAAGRTSR